MVVTPNTLMNRQYVPENYGRYHTTGLTPAATCVLPNAEIKLRETVKHHTKWRKQGSMIILIVIPLFASPGDSFVNS